MAKKDEDLGQAEVQGRRDEQAEKGYFGQKAGVISNREYSLQSGPGSPSPLEAHLASAERRIDHLRSSAAKKEA